uniref:Uncharacterized protein n=1 Tax=Arundo donax TaxID=35708 RepID=A0A0A9F7T4_ARUDO
MIVTVHHGNMYSKLAHGKGIYFCYLTSPADAHCHLSVQDHQVAAN